MQGLGYKELLSFFEGELSLEEAVELIKRDSRHFAKRQLTWFRRERDAEFFSLDGRSDEAVLEDLLAALRGRGVWPAQQRETKERNHIYSNDRGI